MRESTGELREWIIPSAFLICAGWVIWHMPAFILDLYPPDNQSLVEILRQLHERKDVSPGLPGLFGGYADAIDWLAMVLIPVLFVWGSLTVRIAHNEFKHWRQIDRPTLFISRITMILIIAMSCIMLYEVFLRYVFEAPTLWANEMTQWLACFVFLFSGLYAMQQRCHIRIFLLYDMLSRRTQRILDVIAVIIVCIPAFFLVYGSYIQVFVNKFYKWEMYGTAFDPPLPATVLPAILIVITLIALQSVINIFSDWNEVKVLHSAAEQVDQEEIDALKRNVGVQ
ncbi:TRAP-type mannitol/chloroaromatic compound transport system, small permease component [Cohaesibacter sp. ES.047]|uniref:TRAP transporter small permease subunit n=1 Tax=Cohaesibacter sp. ES.047 TaxID=1798205 RepID=UPI000BB9889B|nr:TRAP transporter small permease [Cohaesibacter sp. ES.047]SNY91619.1 TRAP-type mannitol/chloroaromatic compound transport system, small permease component [Cohaesibacter sp. ES.047]